MAPAWRGPLRAATPVGCGRPRPVDAPAAVLLDAGGIVVLPTHERILGAFDRAECPVDPAVLDRAHYAATVAFGPDADLDADWAGVWEHYLQRYVEACGVPEPERPEVHRHLDSEFADAALWERVVPGVHDELRALADTGVTLGVVTNADGMMAARLRSLGVLQVGPGLGVPVSCVIDSGTVGVMKPDPRIFRIALDALDLAAEQVWFLGDSPAFDVVGARRAGLRPFLLDPLGVHPDAGCETVRSITELARLVAAARPG